MLQSEKKHIIITKIDSMENIKMCFWPKVMMSLPLWSARTPEIDTFPENRIGLPFDLDAIVPDRGDQSWLPNCNKPVT